MPKPSHSRSSSNEPALGSSGGSGSNWESAYRFCHKGWRKSPNGFMELRDNTMTPQELQNRLEKVKGVSRVQLTHRGDKASQGNPDPYPESEVQGHTQQQRFDVFFEAFPDHPVEFEVTRSRHTMKGQLTQSATFMDCPKVPGLRLESFRVLWDTVQDKALFPDEYLAWWKVVQILEGHQEPDTQVESSPMAVDEQPSKPEPAGDEQPSQPAPSGQPLAAEEALSQQLTALHATAASTMSTDGPHAMQSQHTESAFLEDSDQDQE